MEEYGYNIISNFGLRCFDQRMTANNKLVLKCTFSVKQKDKKTPEGKDRYASQFVDVYCSTDTDISEADYVKKPINVWGNLSMSWYETKDGTEHNTLVVYANKVRIAERG